jgi:hypothetical protein
VDEGDGDGETTERTRRIVLADRSGRRTITGRAPLFAELTAASVEGTADVLQLGAALAGTVPQRMPDVNTSMRITFRLTTDGRGTFTFDAGASDRGWTAVASGGRSESFPGELEVSGRRVEMTIDAGYLGDTTSFRWIASLAWNRTGRGGGTAFDSIPEAGFAHYPGPR